ncbi:MAG: heme-binding domain-containing protein [Bryobacteraceae bacterium]
MPNSKTLYVCLLAGVSATGLMQLMPMGPRENPPVVPGETIEASLDMPLHVTGILDRACKNCHSNDTEWPWYARIAPASWMINADVEAGRKALNLSQWSRVAEKPRAAMGALTAACAAVRTDRMPPKPYRMMHSEARLSADETAALCAWTTAQVSEYRTRMAQAAAPAQPALY